MPLLLCGIYYAYIIGVYAMASGLMAFHYGDILEEFDACPLPLLCGAPETGDVLTMCQFMLSVSTQ